MDSRCAPCSPNTFVTFAFINVRTTSSPPVTLPMCRSLDYRESFSNSPVRRQSKTSSELIYLGRQNKIALRQPINTVRPRGHFRLAPRKQNIRMMPLPFGKCPDLIGKRKRLQKIREFERARDVMPVHHLPLRDLLRERFQLFARQRRHSSAARDAILARKIAHGIGPPRIIPHRDCTGTRQMAVAAPCPHIGENQSLCPRLSLRFLCALCAYSVLSVLSFWGFSAFSASLR